MNYSNLGDGFESLGEVFVDEIDARSLQENLHNLQTMLGPAQEDEALRRPHFLLILIIHHMYMIHIHHDR